MYQTYEHSSQQRLIVVANRLPVSAVRERDGSWSLQVRQSQGRPSMRATHMHHACQVSVSILSLPPTALDHVRLTGGGRAQSRMLA